MSSVPHSVRMESAIADPSTTFNDAQKKGIRTAINYCSVVEPSIANLERLLKKVENGSVLSKRD